MQTEVRGDPRLGARDAALVRQAQVEVHHDDGQVRLVRGRRLYLEEVEEGKRERILRWGPLWPIGSRALELRNGRRSHRSQTEDYRLWASLPISQASAAPDHRLPALVRRLPDKISKWRGRKMSAKRILALTIAALAVSAVLAASAVAAPVKPTDYQSRSHWLYLPGESVKQKKIAVFYVYPTAYSRAPGGPIYCAVDNAGMMKSARGAYARQAMAFNPSANIYAPFYRQIDATYQLGLSAAQQKANIAREPADRRASGLRVLPAELQQGRPFILVAHSQGSAVAKLLLSGYIKSHPAVYERMIAAYVVGYPIQDTYLEHHPYLKFAKGPSDTGVIVSWNTEAPTVDGKNPVVQPGAVAINPITWTRSQTEASAAKNGGSIELDPATGGTPVLNGNGTIKRFMNVADARVDKAKGVVVCSTINAADPPYFTPGGFPMGVLHTFDYPLYFFSVRANAANRVQHFFAER